VPVTRGGTLRGMPDVAGRALQLQDARVPLVHGAPGRGSRLRPRRTPAARAVSPRRRHVPDSNGNSSPGPREPEPAPPSHASGGGRVDPRSPGAGAGTSPSTGGVAACAPGGRGGLIQVGGHEPLATTSEPPQAGRSPPVTPTGLENHLAWPRLAPEAPARAWKDLGGRGVSTSEWSQEGLPEKDIDLNEAVRRLQPARLPQSASSSPQRRCRR